MTEKLYHTDPNLLNFSARVVESRTEGDCSILVLDKTAFYPTSGGQLYDMGKINGVEVAEVTIDDDKIIHHRLAKPLPDGTVEVTGEIDFERRQKHRQQHTSQHIISQTMHRHYDYRTVSVHLGAEYGAIEVTTDNITEQELEDIEQKTNRIIIENHPITIKFVTKEEAKELPLRRFPEVDGDTMRIIQVGEYDYSACGGTHLNSTAEAMMVKIIGTEKIRGHVLVKFLCGYQILDDYKKRFDITTQVTKTYTINLLDIPDKIARLEEENKQFKREIVRLQTEMIPAQAEQLAREQFELGEHNYVIAQTDSFDKNLTRTLANAVTEKIDGSTILLAEDKIIILSGNKLDAGKLAKFISEKSSLKGGGNNKMAQLGGNSNLTPDDIKSYLKEFLGV